MPDKLKAAAVAGGVLAAVAFQVGGAQAATHTAPPGSHPGLRDPAAHPKAVNPDASCGGITWQDRYDNKYLEIYHSGKADGNWADAFAGNGSCTQHWDAVASGSWNNGAGQNFDLYGMVNTNSDLCLSAPLTNVGTSHVEQEACGFSRYNYKWAELSGPSGWILDESNPHSTQPIYDVGVIACEDIDNHWIYTSKPANVLKGSSTPKNCIWH